MFGGENPEIEEFLPNLSDEDLSKLIISVMAMPIKQAQVVVPGLEKFTLFDLTEIYKKTLKNGISIEKFATDVPFDDPFTPEEDCLLLSSLRWGSQSFGKVLQSFGSSFHLNRSLQSILERRDYLEKLSDEEKDKIINDFTKEIMREEAYFLSTENTEEMIENGLTSNNFTQLRCVYEPEEKRELSENLDNEIDSLMKVSNILASTDRPNDKIEELAVIRGEKIMYTMKRKAIIVGRATNFAEVDVNLSLEGEKKCVHVSRRQAIISFLPDCNFYIENIGNRPFRVNGVPIPQGKMCRIPPFAILDFSGVLLMFIPNEKFIEEVRKFVSFKYN